MGKFFPTLYCEKSLICFSPTHTFFSDLQIRLISALHFAREFVGGGGYFRGRKGLGAAHWVARGGRGKTGGGGGG